MRISQLVLGDDGKPCGTMEAVICLDYRALDKVMRFSTSIEAAEWQGLSNPTSFGFVHFEEQLPPGDIYPVAVLEDLKIDRSQRRHGYGTLAIQAFRALAAENGARLGLLRIGCYDYENEMPKLKNFYAMDGWRPFVSPNIDGLILVWMFHLLPPITDLERAARKRLLEAPEEKPICEPL